MLVLVCLSIVVLGSCVSGGKFYLLFSVGYKRAMNWFFSIRFSLIQMLVKVIFDVNVLNAQIP